MKNKYKILEKIIEITKLQLDGNNDYDYIGVDAKDLSIQLQINRANLSKTLNELWKDNKLIKVNGRPTIFIPIEIISTKFPENFFSSYYVSYNELKKEINQKQQEISITSNQKIFLNKTQKQLSTILSFPLLGYPPLITFEKGLNKIDFVYQVFLFLKDSELLSKNMKFEYIDCFTDIEILDELIKINNHSSTNYSENKLYFINNIHALNADKIKKLDSFFFNLKTLEQSIFKNSKFVLGCDTFSEFKTIESVSFTIKTVPFDELSILDQLQFIIDTFKYLANKTNIDIRIQKQLFKAFCINEIETDYALIEKDISNALIKSYNRSLSESRTYCLMLWSDFSFPLIHKNIPKHTPLNIIDSYYDDMIIFNKDKTTKFDYIYNQPIIYELEKLINKTNFKEKSLIDEFLISYTNRIKIAKTSELQALIIHSGYSKFNNEKLHGSEKEIGLDFLTSSLNKLIDKDFIPENIEYLYEKYHTFFIHNIQSNIGLLLLIDSRHNKDTYFKILEKYNIKYNIITLQTPLTIDELSQIIDEFSPIENVVIITDIIIYQNLENLLHNVVNQNIVSYYPLSLPLLENLIDKIEKLTSIEQLKKEKYLHSENKSDLDDDENSFVSTLTQNYLKPTLTFLDADKAVEKLYPTLTNILNNLKLSHSKEFVVKYLLHVTFMIERCIKGNYLDYPDLNQSLKINSKIFQLIEKELLTVEESFGIKIPLSEIGYIVDIFMQK